MEKPNVFIAHNDHDKEVAERIAKSLEYEDVLPRIDSWEVAPGDSFVEWMNISLGECKFLLLVWSENAAKSDWVKREWSSFLPRVVRDKSIKIVPILLDDTPRPPLLDDIVYIRYQRNMMALMNQILTAIYGPASRKSHRERLAEAQVRALKYEGDPLPYVACPVCGSIELEFGSDGDEYGTYEVVFVKCSECDWIYHLDTSHLQSKKDTEDEAPYTDDDGFPDD